MLTAVKPLAAILVVVAAQCAVAADSNDGAAVLVAREVDARDPFRSHHEMALTAWEAVLKHSNSADERQEALIRMAESQLVLGQYASALASTDQAMLIGPLTSRARCVRAKALFVLGSDEAGVRECMQAIELDAQCAPAYLMLAMATLPTSRTQSKEYLDKAIALNPQDPVAYQFLAVWYLLGDRKAEALQCVDEYLSRLLTGKDGHLEINGAVEKEATSSQAVGLGRVTVNSPLEKGERQLATQQSALKDVAPSEPASVFQPPAFSAAPIGAVALSDAYELRGHLCLQLGDYENALDDYVFAHRLNPSSLRAATGVVSASVALGRPTVAYYLSCALLETTTDSPELYRLRSSSLRTLGRFDEAINDLSRAIQLAPEEGTAFRDRGDVRVMQGNYEAALEDFRHALRLDENDPVALTYMAMLRATAATPEFRNGAEAEKVARRACELTGWKCGLPMVALALAHAERGAFADAVEILRKVQTQAESFDESDVDPLMNLFRSKMPYRRMPQVGHTGADTLAQLQEVWNGAPRVGLEAESRRLLGVCKRLLDRDALAEESRNMVVAKAGYCLLLLGRYREAVDMLSQAIDDRPVIPTVAWLRARASLATDEPAAECVHDCKRAMQVDPQFAPAFALAGWMLVRANLSDDAGRWIDHAIELDPAYAPAYYYRALTQAKDPQMRAQSLESVNRCLELDPLPDVDDVSEPYSLRGALLLERGQSEAALDNVFVASELAPDTWTTFRIMCSAYLQLGKPRLALRAAERWSNLAPTNPRAHHYLAYLRTLTGQVDDALPAAKQAESLDGSNAAIHRLCATICELKGRYQDALNEYERALEIKGDDVKTLVQMARFLVTCPDESMRDVSKADALIERANATTKPWTHAAIAVRALILNSKNDRKEAIGAMEKALAMVEDGTDEARLYTRIVRAFRAERPIESSVLHEFQIGSLERP